MLTATQPPLAEAVYVAYFGMVPPELQERRQMMGMPPLRGDENSYMPVSQLGALSERLAKANIRLNVWNVGQSRTPPPDAYASDDRDEDQPAGRPGEKPLPRVYIVLPPGEPMQAEDGRPTGPPFSDADRDTVISAISKGAGSIFLTGWSGDPEYKWNDYLTKDWGLKVRNEMRVMQGIPTGQDGVWKINPLWFEHMLVNRFDESSPIGKALRNRRTLLDNASPIETVGNRPAGVTYKTILEVAAGDRGYWAAKDVRTLVRQLQTLHVVKFNQEGDKKPPLTLMIEARQTAPGKRGAVIVFPAGRSFLDNYLTVGPPQLTGEGGMTFDPPPDVNPEIMIDSIYHLAGQDRWIATAPASEPPINVPENRVTAVQVGVVGVLPLLVLLIGGSVIWLRRMK